MGMGCCPRRGPKVIEPSSTVVVSADLTPKPWYSRVGYAVSEIWSRISWSSLQNAYRVATNQGIDTALTLARPPGAPVFDFKTPAGTQVVVCDPAIARVLFNDVRKSEVGPFDDHENKNIFIQNLLAKLFPEAIKRLGLDGAANLLVISAAEAAHIKTLRAPYLGALGKSTVEGYKAGIHAIADRMLEGLAIGSSCNAARLGFEFAVRVVSRMVIGYEASNEEVQGIARSLDAFSKHMTRILLHRPASPAEKFEFEWAIGEMRRVIELNIANSVKFVADARAAGQSDFQIQCTLFFLYFAASETTAATLNHFVWRLGKKENREIQERLRREIRSGVADAPNTLLQRVIRENLRLHPSAFIIGRTPRVDLRLSVKDGDGREVIGKVFRAGQNILIHVRAMALDPRHYPDPERFDPDRFRDSLAMPWMPFGAGPHVCPGQFLALAELESFVQAIITRFSISSLSPESFKQEGIFTLRGPDALIRLDRIPSTS